MWFSNIKTVLIIVVFFTVLCPLGVQSTLRGGEMSAREQFKVRGFHIDLRIQVMTMDALKDFARELADFGFNTLVMEWEGTYPFEKHVVISNRYAYTREEVKSFVEYCAGLGIGVIPLQQCFGHVEYILRHESYAHLKEDPQDISQLCPMQEEAARKLFSELISDMASLHPSRYFHIGGDETWLLGNCDRCAKKAADQGKSKLYVDYIKMICEIVIDLGKRPVLWADIVLKYPEAVSMLPRETVFVDWNYGWALDHFGEVGKLQEQGCEFWGAPSLRSHPDNYYLACWEKHFNNLRDFIPYARKARYSGIIMTSWSTSGLYGYEWDSFWEVIEMHTIRHVYPLAGYRILLSAYARALDRENPIQPAAFVAEYARERFGLTEDEGNQLWVALTTDPSVVTGGKNRENEDVRIVLNRVRDARNIMHSLKPLAHQKEFEHFRLMFDIREHYLRFKEVESSVQSEDFSRKDRIHICQELERLMAEADSLDKRFAEQNRGFLYDSEIAQENMVRRRKMSLLYERLAGKR
jgi:hexosaminidase